MSSRRTALLVGAGLMSSVACTNALAANPIFSIPAQDLSAALKAFAAQSGVAIVASADLVKGRPSGAAIGALSPDVALDDILRGSGLRAEKIGGAFVVRADAPSMEADDDIIVTGTRIRGAAPIGSPLTVIDRKAIEDSGRTTVAGYIETLPQNFGGGPSEAGFGTSVRNGSSDNAGYGSSINLRGLGTESTLVLFDGNRPALGGVSGSFADLSLVPATAIDRIEILTDGASAIYGTDAVAGVVNVRFRKRLDGFETEFTSGTAGGAYHQVQAGQAVGKRWSTGGAMLAYQYDHHGALAGDSRRVSTEDLRPFGGPDLRSTFSVPGTLIAADGSVYAIPTGQDGRALTAGELLPGQENRTDQRRYDDLLPRQTTHSIYAAADQELGRGVTANASLLYARRRFASVNQANATRDPVTVPVSNPFYVDPIGTGEPVTVDYDFAPEVGRYREKGSVSALTSSASLSGKLGDWHVELGGAYGRQAEHNHGINALSDARIADALADTDPATALNVFGDGSANNPATIAAIRATTSQRDRYRVWSTSLRADGALFDLPAGPVKLAVGAEHRDERFVYVFTTTQYSTDPLVEIAPGTPGHRRIDALYAELSVPLFNAANAFPGRLDASLAARTDRYSDVGRTTNPKAGIRWQPLPGVALRGSYGTSFRAPSFTENVGTANNYTLPVYLEDPASATGQTAVIAKLGNAPNLKPERATSWTAGVDLTPTVVPGLTAKASYFNIAYRDRIGSANADYAMFLLQRNVYGGLIQDHPDAATVAALYAAPQFQNPFGIAASAIGAIIDLETLNLSRVTVRGIDLDVNYARPLDGGTATLGITGTRLLAIDQRLTASAPADDVAGTFDNPVKLRLRGDAGWGKGGFSTNLFVNYTAGYTNQLVLPSEHVASWTTIDGQIGYRFANASPLAGARIALSALNLFDRRPPYVRNSVFDSTLAYDPGQANALGRVVSVQASFSW